MKQAISQISLQAGRALATAHNREGSRGHHREGGDLVLHLSPVHTDAQDIACTHKEHVVRDVCMNGLQRSASGAQVGAQQGTVHTAFVQVYS